MESISQGCLRTKALGYLSYIFGQCPMEILYRRSTKLRCYIASVHIAHIQILSIGTVLDLNYAF